MVQVAFVPFSYLSAKRDTLLQQNYIDELVNNM
jgi:hypothetical protein